jgi:hypothetical protein
MAPTDVGTHISDSEPREDLIVLAMIFAVGVLGIALGLIGDRQTELSVGLLLVLFAGRVARDSHRDLDASNAMACRQTFFVPLSIAAGRFGRPLENRAFERAS